MAGGMLRSLVPSPHPRSTRWPEECPLTEMGGILGTSERVPKLRGGCVQCISPVPSRVDIFILVVVVLDLQVGADTLFSGDCHQRGDSGRSLGTRGQSGLPVGWCPTVLLSESHLLGLAWWLVARSLRVSRDGDATSGLWCPRAVG